MKHRRSKRRERAVSLAGSLSPWDYDVGPKIEPKAGASRVSRCGRHRRRRPPQRGPVPRKGHPQASGAGAAPFQDQHRTVEPPRRISLVSGRTAIPHPGRTQPKLESTPSGEPTPRTASGGTRTCPPIRWPRTRRRLVRQRTRRTWPGLHRSLAVTRTRLRTCLQLELGPCPRSPQTSDGLPSGKITPRASRRNGTSRRSVPGMIRPARSSVPLVSGRWRDLRAKALVPRWDGSRPTRARSREHSPSSSAPNGRAMRHPKVSGPRLKRRHRTPGPSQRLAPAELSGPPSRERLVGRAGLSLLKVQRAPSWRTTVWTPSPVSRESAARS
jgi:hypothetical protein